MGPPSGHGLGNREIALAIGGHAHNLFTGFLSEAGTTTAGPIGMLAFVHSVGRFGNASPLLTPTAATRSFHEGRLEVVMRLHHYDRRVQCFVSQQSCKGNASIASPPHTG
jgi:hypothetical protein